MNRKHMYLAVGLGVVVIVVLAIISRGRIPAQPQSTPQLPYDVIAESADVVLMADTGLNIEWLVDSEALQNLIF